LLSNELQFLLNSLTVVGSLFLLYYLVNRFDLRFGPRGGRNLELLERLPLSGDSGLVVFRAGKRKFLGFYSKGDFKLLKELEDEEDGSAFGSNSGDGVGRDS